MEVYVLKCNTLMLDQVEDKSIEELEVAKKKWLYSYMIAVYPQTIIHLDNHFLLR